MKTDLKNQLVDCVLDPHSSGCAQMEDYVELVISLQNSSKAGYLWTRCATSSFSRARLDMVSNGVSINMLTDFKIDELCHLLLLFFGASLVLINKVYSHTHVCVYILIYCSIILP
jgi:hypothetical protein